VVESLFANLLQGISRRKNFRNRPIYDDAVMIKTEGLGLYRATESVRTGVMSAAACVDTRHPPAVARTALPTADRLYTVTVSHVADQRPVKICYEVAIGQPET